MAIADTPEPPYYAVIFATVLSDDTEGYGAMARKMFPLATEHPGCLGFEVTGDGRTGIGVSYWADEDAIRSWKADAEHRVAQELGRERWYSQYHLRVARVERDYGYGATPPR